MLLVNALCRAARALRFPPKPGEYPVSMSARVRSESSAFEEVTLISRNASETQVKHESRVNQRRRVGSPESQLPGNDALSEQDRLIHSLHQDACEVSASRLL